MVDIYRVFPGGCQSRAGLRLCFVWVPEPSTGPGLQQAAVHAAPQPLNGNDGVDGAGRAVTPIF